MSDESAGATSLVNFAAYRSSRLPSRIRLLFRCGSIQCTLAKKFPPVMLIVRAFAARCDVPAMSKCVLRPIVQLGGPYC